MACNTFDEFSGQRTHANCASNCDLLWHYTLALNMDSIFRDGLLRQSVLGFDNPREYAVWFSRNQVWENTVKKLLPTSDYHPTFTAMAAMGICRIGVAKATAPYNWNDYQRLSGMDRESARSLERLAKKWGATHRDWYVSFEPVPRSQWLSVQKWDHFRWVDYPNWNDGASSENLPHVARPHGYMCLNG